MFSALQTLDHSVDADLVIDVCLLLSEPDLRVEGEVNLLQFFENFAMLEPLHDRVDLRAVKLIVREV